MPKGAWLHSIVAGAEIHEFETDRYPLLEQHGIFNVTTWQGAKAKSKYMQGSFSSFKHTNSVLDIVQVYILYIPPVRCPLQQSISCTVLVGLHVPSSAPLQQPTKVKSKLVYSISKAKLSLCSTHCKNDVFWTELWSILGQFSGIWVKNSAPRKQFRPQKKNYFRLPDLY